MAAPYFLKKGSSHESFKRKAVRLYLPFQLLLSAYFRNFIMPIAG